MGRKSTAAAPRAVRRPRRASGADDRPRHRLPRRHAPALPGGVMSLWPKLAELPLVVEGYELDTLSAEMADGRSARRSWSGSTAAATRGSARTSASCPTTTTRSRRCRPRCRWRANGRSRASATTSARSSSGWSRRSGTSRACGATGRSSRPRSTSRCARPAARCTRCSSASRGRCASSTRSGSATRPSTDTIHRRLARYPDVHFKLDAAAAWNLALCEDLAATGAVEVVDFKGQYGMEVEDEDALAAMYGHVVATFPDAILEDPHDLPAAARRSRRTPTASPTTR